jgi:hypothetical protein
MSSLGSTWAQVEINIPVGMMDGKKYIFEVLYYPSYDSHTQKTQF